MGQTIAEKIFSRHAGYDVVPGDVVIVPVDCLVSPDSKTLPALKTFASLGGRLGIDPNKVVFILDHYVPCPSEVWANNHKRMRDFAMRFGFHFFDQGMGICHGIVPEYGFALPGDIVACADGQASTYGAVNALSISIASGEIASVLRTGKLWFKVPESVRINLIGKLPDGVYAKDIILKVVSEIGPEGASYQAIEFGGEVVQALDMAGRFTLCNMTIHLGAKTAFIEPDQTMEWWVSSRSRRAIHPAFPDIDATYSWTITLDVTDLVPLVACPGSIAEIRPASEFEGTRIDQVFIGSCANSRTEDLRVAADILKGHRISPGVRLIVAPGSRLVYDQALEQGILKKLWDAGAQILPPCCGCCVAVNGNYFPAAGEVVLSTANKNERGRLGNCEADIYLSSPATAAASARMGAITDPRALEEQP